MTVKKSLGRWLAGAAALTASALSFAATELTVYTAFEAEDLKRYKQEFEKRNPDVEINWVRDSTGIVTAKLLAEKENPQADVVWGLAGTSLLILKGEQMLQPYTPVGFDKLSPKFRDNSAEPSWVGLDAWMAGICVNTVEAKKHNLPMPTSWKDLTKPVYKGHIIMPNPASSGTGFLDVSSWLQMFGTEDGWQYMDQLHTNISRYTHSGSKPCKLAAAGETSIGISFAFRGAKEKKKGAPVEIVYPTEGLGWDMESAAIVKGTDKLDAAKKLLDFAVSKDAMKMYNKGYAIVAMPGVAQPVEFFPENPEELIIDNNFEWAAQNRKDILKEWTTRYDSKSDPK
ncbi:MAG: putative 2-aminoethylphosphonate ABC transporter substrate-binding protein [Pseudomonadales bacterium]|nr:putative 2-aminoethylphosphonate ABC transporter substrate-binding protein [Pseudomonadales bacterium]